MRAFATRYCRQSDSVVLHGLWHKHNMGKTDAEVKQTKASASSGDTWMCAKCTCKNPQSRTKCEACGELAPPKVQDSGCL